MQPRLTVGILVLQAEVLVRAIRYLGFLFQTTFASIVTEPQEVAVFIGHLTREANLVAVEVVGLLAAFVVCGCSIADLRQGVVRIAHAPRQDWRFRLGYGLLILVRFLIFCYIRNSDIFIIKHIIPNLLIKFFCGHLLRYFKGCVSTRKLIIQSFFCPEI